MASKELEPRSPSPSCAKILMLHGEGQSGQFFRCKTEFLQPSVRSMLLNSTCKDTSQSPFNEVRFYYPSGLLPDNPDTSPDEKALKRTWGYGDVELERIRGLETTIDYILRFLDSHGPFIGIMGFSSGAIIAATVASLLEKRRSIGSLRFNASHPSLDFVVSFCGCPLEHSLYKPLYNPKIETPTLHVIGTIDTTIDECQSLRLLDYCTDSALHYFFGTHHVPRSVDFLDALTRFFEHVYKDKEGEGDEWEDLDD
ncbi:hypothetical protein N7478_005937 [Penicillium angulare]|uniref:uncharacterized protein n=1 Tax=Penicillium angulare TaxID=116970 RepID=UPI0025415EC3|nr:uncharacterized protein N7478_005937 [Penicillium angulare]KAJ5280565.1 hypothetical protein N7478_005937 [Penicillium angulare]